MYFDFEKFYDAFGVKTCRCVCQRPHLQLCDLQAAVVHPVVPEADVNVLTQRGLGALEPQPQRVQVCQAGGEEDLPLHRLRLHHFHHALLDGVLLLGRQLPQPFLLQPPGLVFGRRLVLLLLLLDDDELLISHMLSSHLLLLGDCQERESCDV